MKTLAGDDVKSGKSERGDQCDDKCDLFREFPPDFVRRSHTTSASRCFFAVFDFPNERKQKYIKGTAQRRRDCRSDLSPAH